MMTGGPHHVILDPHVMQRRIRAVQTIILLRQEDDTIQGINEYDIFVVNCQDTLLINF